MSTHRQVYLCTWRAAQRSTCNCGDRVRWVFYCLVVTVVTVVCWLSLLNDFLPLTCDWMAFGSREFQHSLSTHAIGTWFWILLGELQRRSATLFVTNSAVMLPAHLCVCDARGMQGDARGCQRWNKSWTKFQRNHCAIISVHKYTNFTSLHFAPGVYEHTYACVYVHAARHG